MKYYISKTINASFDQAIERVSEKLKTEGFGVLTEIDIQEKLKEKLDVDFRKYTILGACNPVFAHEALKQENKVGVMLPCNIIVQELDHNNIEIAAVNPVASMLAIKNDSLIGIANEINDKLNRVIKSL